jgi:hypothetical protein
VLAYFRVRLLISDDFCRGIFFFRAPMRSCCVPQQDGTSCDGAP